MALFSREREGDVTHTRRLPTWRLALAVGVALSLLYPLLSWIPGDIAYLGVGIGALAALGLGLRRNRPARPWPWRLFGLGLGLAILGDLVYAAATAAVGDDPPFPHISDVPYLAGMTCVAVGGGLLAWHRHRASTHRALLDAGIVTTAGALLLWLVIGSPIVRTPDVTWLEVAVSLAYPMFDTVLLGVLAALGLGGRGATGSTRLLMTAFSIQVIADTLYATAAVEGSYVGGGLLDSAWLLTYVCIGAAALHPSTARSGDPTPPRLVELSARHLAAVVVPVAVAAGAVLFVGHRFGTEDPDRFLLDLTVAVPLAFVAGLLLLIRVASATNELARTTRERDEARRRELAIADVTARLARSDDVEAVRAALEGARELTLWPVEEVQLTLPEDAATSPPPSSRRGPAVATIPLTNDQADGAIVVRGDHALSDDETAAFERLTSDVVMALDRCRLAQELRRNESRFRSLVRHAPDAITVHDADGTLTYVSPALGHILGRDERDLLGVRWQELLHPEDRLIVHAAVEDVQETTGAARVVEARLRHADGTWRWVEARVTNLLDDPSVGGIVTNHRDITERQRLQRQLEHQATHDPLTGVANRRRFGEEVRRQVADVADADAVVYLDLDHFKEINDRLGHAAGDQVLATVARRLTVAVRQHDLVARLGGDEFAVLLRGTSSEEASVTAERLLAAVQRPIRIGAEQVTVAASVGLSVSEPSTDADPSGHPTRDLLHDADLAMYAAKAGGRGRVERATPEVRQRSAERLAFESDLRLALDEGGLSLAYLPVVDLADRHLREIRAELRWRHPVRGDIPASAFLPVAARIGVLDTLATWMFNEACWSARTWIDLHPELQVSVPFPGAALRTPGMATALEASLTAAGLRGGHVILQIAGSTVLDEPLARETIGRLQDAGMVVRLTDFGTDTPMRAVRDAPVDELLLSATLVAGLAQGPEEAALGRAVLLLADSFGLEVVAAGITTEHQLEELRERGARRGSGPLLGHTMTADEVATTLTGARPTLAVPPG